MKELVVLSELTRLIGRPGDAVVCNACGEVIATLKVEVRACDFVWPWQMMFHDPVVAAGGDNRPGPCSTCWNPKPMVPWPEVRRV